MAVMKSAQFKATMHSIQGLLVPVEGALTGIGKRFHPCPLAQHEQGVVPKDW